jgi:plastocyanin
MSSATITRGRIILFTLAILTFGGNCFAKAAGSDTASVSIESFQFQPKKVSVRKGGTVTFTNHDAAPHTVSPAKGATFTGTGRLLKGESKTVQFDDVGTQNYGCDFHPSMKGTIVVVDK